MEKETLLEIVEQLPSRNIRISLAKLDPSQSAANQHIYQLEIMNIRYQEVLHELTNEQDQWRVRIKKKLLANDQDIRFLRRIVIGDEN